MIAPFVIFNGDIVPSDKPVFSSLSRAVRYGDGLFETIRSFSGSPVFLEKHISRITHSASFLGLDLPFTLEDNLLNLIQKLIIINEINGDARVRLSLFRKGEGFYLSSSSSADFLLETNSIDRFSFNNSESKYKLTICESIKRCSGIIANLKTLSSLSQVIAAKEVQSKGFEEGLILNEFGRIACGVSSNVFMVESGKVYTPLLSEACVAGTMRQVVIELLSDAGISVLETKLLPSDLQNAEEVFLTNAIKGIIPVCCFKEKNFNSAFTVEISEILNQFLKNELD
jgi:branched-chain amino acid aminotransferase